MILVGYMTNDNICHVFSLILARALQTVEAIYSILSTFCIKQHMYSVHSVLSMQMMEVDIFSSEPDVLISAVK